MNGVSIMTFRKILPIKAEINPITYVALQVKCLHLFTYHKKIMLFVVNWCRRPEMNFQENHSNGSRDAAEKLYCSSNKVPLIIDRSRPNLCLLSRICVECQIWIYKENICTRSQDAAEKACCSSSKGALVIDRWQINLKYLQRTCVVLQTWIFNW